MNRRRFLFLVGVIVALVAGGAVVVSPAFRWQTTVIAVSIENQESARPHQLGLKEALMVQEWLVEGGITRFIALFDTENIPETIGPVRSLRPNLIESTLPWTKAFIYAGGSPEAYALLQSHPDILDFNGLRGDADDSFFRDKDIPAPHNYFIRGEAIEALAVENNLETIAWPPYETGRPSGSSATLIDLEFYNTLHDIRYEYSPRSGVYDRTNGLVKNHGEPVNVLIIQVPLLGTGELGRLDMPVRGEGPLLLFSRGTIQRGTWHKSKTEESFEFLNEDDEPLIFAPGQTWLTSLPTLNRVSWK